MNKITMRGGQTALYIHRKVALFLSATKVSCRPFQAAGHGRKVEEEWCSNRGETNSGECRTR
jgi:hypothetical protein